MQKLIITFATVMLLAFAANAQIHISGALRGTLEDTTYIVDDDIWVEEGDSLVIEAGAELQFNACCEFDINGYIHAAGTETDSVKFIRNFPDSAWGGIDFNISADDLSCLEYCLITGSNDRGIYCYLVDPTIENCKITGNSTVWRGGGIYCYYSSPIIKKCTITGNSVGLEGGGIHCGYNSSPIIETCDIRINSAGFFGGGIYCGYNSSPIIENCIISENLAGSIGGGIHCEYYSSPTVENCSISENSVDFIGGGISCNESSSPNINYCTISNNSADYSGGGISCYVLSSPFISHCTISGNSAGGSGGGIRCVSNSYPTILNSIIEGNNGNGGCSFYTMSSYNLIAHNDFYNNEGGNFTGNSVPQWLGLIVTVNVNDDSCDMFYNIFEDPLFVDPSGGDYHLQAGSPCIDAGDPESPPDPDFTIADIGAFYFDQSQLPSITVTLNPYNPPIQIPVNGGTFDFNIAITNNDSLPTSFEVWTMATLPDSSEYGPIIGPLNLAFIPGFSANRDRTQNVPGNAPAGNYTYDAYLGIYPNTIWAEDHFDFEKLDYSYDTDLILDWDNWGESLTGLSEPVSASTPIKFTFLSVYPNPFNLETTLRFDIAEPGDVSLVIYDIQGREVAWLVDGFMSAGMYQRTFDGSELSSGVYFACLEAEGFCQTRKMLFIK